MIRFYLTAMCALGASVLSACSVLPDPAPPNIVYRLSMAGEAVTPDRDATVIRVDRPSAISVFNTRSIVVSPDGRRLATAAQAEWPEGTPTMLQQSLIDAFSRSSKIIGVLPQSGTRTDTRIHLTIKNFEAQFDQGESAAPKAVVAYDVTLANATDRKLISTFSTKQTVRAKAARISAIVTALESANNDAMQEIVDWVEAVDSEGMIQN